MKENAFYNTENNDLKQLDDILKKTPFLNGFEKGEDDDK